ncbi:MAG: hypothetical protein ACXADB_00440 [Candidatus Hermodarchaeia archaeon]|jgi:hypothetical protein
MYSEKDREDTASITPEREKEFENLGYSKEAIDRIKKNLAEVGIQ